jgi:recombination protein RecT
MKTEDLKVIEPRFVKLTNEETFNKEASFALQIINKSEQLQKCTKESLISAVLNIANTGLTLNPVMKLAYIVPRYVRGVGMEACLEPSYQGLVKLLTDTGSVTSITANIVYENDEFSYELGTAQSVRHVQKLGNKGKVVGAYAVATLHNGVKMVEVMDIEELNAIRDTSESYKAFVDGKIKACVWNTYPTEMYRKTTLRRIVKYLPKTERWDKMQEAISLDESDFKVSDSQLGYIDSLLHTAIIAPELYDKISREMYSYTATEAGMCISMLKEAQPSIEDKVRGGTASQKEISAYIETKE